VTVHERHVIFDVLTGISLRLYLRVAIQNGIRSGIFSCWLFYGAVSISDHIASNGIMTGEELIGKYLEENSRNLTDVLP
jgi:hypothetical protein